MKKRKLTSNSSFRVGDLILIILQESNNPDYLTTNILTLIYIALSECYIFHCSEFDNNNLNNTINIKISTK